MLVRDVSENRIVIPAKAGIHASCWRWIPAFAGMTMRRGGDLSASDATVFARKYANLWQPSCTL
jgi:hypothetical protein